MPRPARAHDRPARALQADAGRRRVLARRRAPAQLQRIYGTAWESEAALADYLHRLEEAERRDHRRLGMELDLFHFPPEIGGGLPVFHPKGALVRQLMEDFSLRMHLAHGYEQVWTPHITKSTLYETSGHLSWYAASMYPPMQMEGPPTT